MKKAVLRKEITKITRFLRKKHSIKFEDIKIDRKRQVVAVGDLFFCQGQDAQELIDEMDKGVEYFGVTMSERVWLLWHLNSIGILKG